MGLVVNFVLSAFWASSCNATGVGDSPFPRRYTLHMRVQILALVEE